MPDLGFDIQETNRSFDRAGITGTITKFVLEEKEYPLICIDMLEAFPSQLKLQLLTTLFSVNKDTSVEDARNSIAVYNVMKRRDGNGAILVENGKEVVESRRLGKIKASQVRSLVNMFKDEEDGVKFELTGFLNKTKVLKGDMLFILSD